MKLRKAVSAAVAAVLVGGLSIAVAPSALADSVTPGTYNLASTSRVLDTRSGVGAPRQQVPALATLTFTLPPDAVEGASAVALEITAVNPGARGFFTVYPAGTGRPAASSLNFEAHQNVPNLVIVKLGAGNKVSIFNGSHGSVDMLADVHGSFLAGANAGDPGTLVPMTPTRFLDTRSGLGAPQGKVAGRSVTKVQIAGLHGIPADASAVALNLTAVQSPGKGFITAYPGSPVPTASSLNYEAGQDRANLTLVELGTDGAVLLYNGSPNPVDLLADVSGYFVGGGTASADGSFTPSSTVRVIDTRTLGTGFVPALATLKVQIFPAGDPFASFIKAVALNVTVAAPEASGFLTTWDGRTPLPAVSNSNFQARHDVAGAVIVPVNDDGTISIYNGSFGNVDLIVDFNGLFFEQPPVQPNSTGTTPNARHAAPTGSALVSSIHRFLATSHRPSVVATR